MDSIKRPKKSAMNVPIQARKVAHQTLNISELPVRDAQSEVVVAPNLDAPEQPQVETKKPKRKERRRAKRAARKEALSQRKGWRRYVTWRRLLLVLLAGLIIVGGIFAYKVYAAMRAFGSGNVAPALTGDLTKLKGEGDGRVNIALLGVGGGDHDGADLSDTIIVASLDVKTKEVAMISVPRDLYVKIPGYGYEKINAANAFGEKYKYDGGGGALAKKTLENVLGVPIHYYARIDFDGFKRAVDIVGGVDITNKSTLIDNSYPCDANQWKVCGYKLTPGTYHMNGSQALKYARCRKGTCGDDYGRAARQQEVLVALRKKALSIGTLSNPAKVASLIDVFGADFKTDLSLAEIKKLVEIGKDVDTSKMINKVLTNNPTDGTAPLVKNGSIGGASVVVPTAGVGNYKAIQAFVRSIFVDSYIKSESAKIEIQNGTTKAGLAASTAELLKSYQYNVINVASADKTTYTTTVIYDYTDGKKPITLTYLENRFGVKAVKANLPTATGGQTTTSPDIRIILGSSYVPED